MSSSNKDFGKRGELLAAKLLKKDGYKIIEMNYRSRFGEVDIIAREGDVLVFVEVKTRSSLDFGSPGEAVTEKKKGHIIQSAQDFLVRFEGMSVPEVRFDVVSLVIDKDAKGSGVDSEIIRDAFDAEGYW